MSLRICQAACSYARGGFIGHRSALGRREGALAAQGGPLRQRCGNVETPSSPHPRVPSSPPVTLLYSHFLSSPFCVPPFRASAPLVLLAFVTVAMPLVVWLIGVATQPAQPKFT